jgi:sugar phosphate isomerase/epimerase
MKHAISNIALRPHTPADMFHQLAGLGLDGLEVAPSRVWADTWGGLSSADVEFYRRRVEAAGIEVIGLHSLLFDQRELALFEDDSTRRQLRDFFVHLSAVCRDLGGRTLIWGGGRKRGTLPVAEACEIAIAFFSEIASKTVEHGTCFCLEPLAPTDTDFINSVLEAKEIVDAVNSPSLQIQIDAKALAANNEMVPETFHAVAENLVHYHANEPGFDYLGASGTVDHAAAGHYLRDIGYDGYVSIEQKMIDPKNPLAAIEKSVSLLKDAYE